MHEMPLYEHNGKTLTEADFVSAFALLGVKNGDTLFVHSDIKVFGKVVATNARTLRASLIGALQKAVGSEGTIVMPAFSYSFTKGETFDREKSRSTVGALTDFFRLQSGVQRSVHPLFSVAAWGRHAAEFMKTSKDSFGEGTAFDTLRKINGTLCMFGTSFQACTFLHHVEQMSGVPYRYMKSFKGHIVDGARAYEDEFTYFVRPLDGTVENDFNVIEEPLRRANALGEVQVGAGTLMCASAHDVYDVATRQLSADPYFFVIK